MQLWGMLTFKEMIEELKLTKENGGEQSENQKENQDSSMSQNPREEKLGTCEVQCLAREFYYRSNLNKNNSSKNKSNSIYWYLSMCYLPGTLLNAFPTSLI